MNYFWFKGIVEHYNQCTPHFLHVPITIVKRGNPQGLFKKTLMWHA